MLTQTRQRPAGPVPGAVSAWRLRVRVHTRAREIPWDDLLRPGRSLIYSWLHRHNPQAAAEIHDGRGMAPFGYSYPTFPDAARREGVYAAGGHGWWDVGTTDARIARALAATLTAKPLVNWGGVALTVTGIDLVRPPVWPRRVTWLTATPLVVRATKEQGSRCLLPDDPSWLPALRASLRSRARAAGVDGADANVWLRWAGGSRALGVSGSDVPRVGSVVRVQVQGSPGLLTVLWSTGLGQQTGAGFGWVDDNQTP